MTQLFLDKDADTIYEELQENNIEDNQEEEYREDRMDQMISRYGYWMEEWKWLKKPRI